MSLLWRHWPRAPRPRTLAEALVLAAMLVTAAGSAVVFWWTARHYYAIWRLTRGVGDTMFFGADGRPWFALDEQRRDVPLDEISPLTAPGGGRGRGPSLLPPRRHRPHRRSAARCGRNVRRGGVAEGGSTLTQQLARTLFLSNRRTLPPQGARKPCWR